MQSVLQIIVTLQVHFTATHRPSLLPILCTFLPFSVAIYCDVIQKLSSPSFRFSLFSHSAFYT